MKNKSQQYPGFTLIELLVVISIISILISILLPALSKARESSKTIQCASNQKSIGIAMSLYVNDSDDYLPAYCESWPSPGWGATYKRYWTNKLAFYLPVKKWRDENLGMMYPYGDVWTCPEVSEGTNYWNGGGYGVFKQGDINTTPQNELVFQYASWRRDGTFTYPGKTMLMTDAGDVSILGQTAILVSRGTKNGTFLYSYRPAPRHGGGPSLALPVQTQGGCNVLFSDRHVAFRDIMSLSNNEDHIFDPEP